MTKPALAAVIQKATNCTGVDARKAVDEIINTIGKSLKKDGTFSLVGLGSFRVSKRKARKGRNPATGEAIKIKASKSVRFKPSASLKQRV